MYAWGESPKVQCLWCQYPHRSNMHAGLTLADHYEECGGLISWRVAHPSASGGARGAPRC